MKVLFGSSLDCLVIILFGIGMSARSVALTPRCLECCFVWNGSACGSRVVYVPQRQLQVLSPRGGNPYNGVWLDVASEWGIFQQRSYVTGALRGENPCSRAQIPSDWNVCRMIGSCRRVGLIDLGTCRSGNWCGS